MAAPFRNKVPIGIADYNETAHAELTVKSFLDYDRQALISNWSTIHSDISE
jgi:hypothetical protein